MARELTYEEAAEALECSKTKVAGWVTRGDIRIVRREPPGSPFGKVWLDGDDVERVKLTWKRQRRAPDKGSFSTDRRIDGRVAAMAYGRFRSGETDADVVIALQLDPLLVRRLRQLYDQTPEKERAEREDKDRRAAQARQQKEHDRKVRAEERERLELEKARIAARATVEAQERAARITARGAGLARKEAS